MLDTHHKLYTFILKNPPENRDISIGKKEKEKKNRKGKDKENSSATNSETPPPPLPNKISPQHAVEEEEDDDWWEDTTQEAQRCRMDGISDHAKGLTLSDDLERTVQECVNILFDFVKKKKKDVIIDSSDKEIVAEAESLDVKATGRLVLTEVLFDEKRVNQGIQAPSSSILSQQLKGSAVPSSWFGMCGNNASSSVDLQDSTYLHGDI